MHHGSGPRHTSLLYPRFAAGLARFAGAVAERFPWVEQWTPVNEPLTTARFNALYGLWYPHARDDRSFVLALLNQCRATVLSMEAIRRINLAARLVQTDDISRTYGTETMIDAERRDEVRLLYEGAHAVAFVTVCARYPYECWVAPIRPAAQFGDLDDAQRADLARALKTVLLKYDGLWHRPMPYLMAWYQAARESEAHPEAHLHAQFHPPYRTSQQLKYLAGTELGAGFYAMDVMPQDKARELQAVEETPS